MIAHYCRLQSLWHAGIYGSSDGYIEGFSGYLRGSIFKREENHIMENVIYLELIKRGFAVDVGIVETAKRNAEGKVVRNYAEVDFIANRGNNKFYIQSAFAMDTEEKQEQEKNSLLNIKDFFKKIIIVKDDIKRKRDENGIVTMSIYDFLLDENSIEY